MYTQKKESFGYGKFIKKSFRGGGNLGDASLEPKTALEAAKSVSCRISKSDLHKKFAFTLAEGATHVAHCDKYRRVAFTLAEVLITLGIIGVVAALTLPTLIQNYQKQVLVNQYKKAYNVLNNGFKQMVAEEGCTSLSCIYSDKTDSHGNLIGLDFDDEKTVNKLTSIFKLSNVQREPKTNSIYGYSMFCLNGVDADTCGIGNLNRDLTPDASFVGTAPDGMFFFISNSLIDNVLFVDVNGLKSPNKLGRDMFFFYYFDYNGSVIVAPYGSMQAMKHEAEIYGSEVPSDEELRNLINVNCDPKSTSYDLIGENCGAKIIMDGWKMNY